jgi:hypothetical protein
MRRRIVASRPDPDDSKRRIYTLDCGHDVSRRTKYGKSWTLCGHCANLREQMGKELQQAILESDCAKNCG